MTYNVILINPTIASDYQTPGGQIPGHEPQEGIDDYKGKTFDERKVLPQEWKHREKCKDRGSGPDDEEVGDDDALD